MATSAAVQHCLVVRSESVHRIQEVQDALTLALWDSVQCHLPTLAGIGASGCPS